MIAVPVVSEQQVVERLRGLDYEATEQRTQTGVFWQSKTTGKHLLVPHASHGTYPSWMLDEIVVNCQLLGDEKAAREVSQLSGWQRLVKTKNGKAKPA
jgi:hypothetical protein